VLTSRLPSATFCTPWIKPSYDTGYDLCSAEQTVDHVVLQCRIDRPRGLHGLTVLDDETIEWLFNTSARSSAACQWTVLAYLHGRGSKCDRREFWRQGTKCNWTKMRTLELRVYMELQNDWVGCSALRSLF